MQIRFFRQWIIFLKRSQIALDIVAILSVIAAFFYYAPPDILNALPATGGDTGSHYWPLHTLVNQGLPNWHVRVWNPGNLGGEPHLTHYFPLPYLFMAFLSLFMSLGTAFNVGSIFPVVVFPVCVYFCFRGLKTKFPTPLLAMMASLSFLYNESFSMWGGNTLSTLAGQFAHVYAFNFFLLGIGCLKWELAKRKTPWISMWLFSFVLLSHFYVALLMPIVFIVFFLFERSENFKERLRRLFLVGMGANLLSIWFILPMLHNSPWNTAFGLEWGGSNLINEIIPKIFFPFCAIAVLGLLAIAYLKIKKVFAEDQFSLILLISLFVLGTGLYFIFPKFGLVDVRVIPALQLAVVLLAAVATSQLFRFYFPKPLVFFLSLLLVPVLFWWPLKYVVNFPGWMKWNYSGWQSKVAYPDLEKLAERVKGDFSMGRIIYENNDYSNAAGTVRVFEMLPYFAGRSTYESVYMQATVLAPAAFYLQAVISKTPSCPFPNYRCTGFDVRRMENYSQLMGISDLILITPELRTQADGVSFLEKGERFGGWYLYSLKEKPKLVETTREPVSWTSESQFKADFYNWFQQYKPTDSFMVVDRKNDKKLFEEKYAQAKDQKLDGKCQPELKVEFDQMSLQTNCPGQLHIIKFAFHPTFQASSKDHLFLISPGFIALFPSKENIVIKWGQHWLWDLSVLISWMTALCWLALIFTRSFACKKS